MDTVDHKPLCEGSSLRYHLHPDCRFIMPHYKEDWFVVGAGRNGMEFSEQPSHLQLPDVDLDMPSKNFSAHIV